MTRQVLTDINMNGNAIAGIPTATLSTQAVNYAQVLALFAGRDFKESVRASSTGNVTVASPAASLDGVTLANGDRILLKNQTTGSENGLYNFNGAGTPLTRSTDGTQGNMTANASVFVEEGSTLADTEWTLSTNNPINVGTTSLTWVQTNGSGSAAGPTYTAGEGISSSAFATNSIAIDRTKVPEFFSKTIGDGTATSFTVAHGLNDAYAAVQVILLSDGSTIDVGVARTDANTVTITTSGTLVIPNNGARVMVLG